MKPDELDSTIGRVLACGQSFRNYLVQAISECELDSSGSKATRLKALLDEASTYLATIDDTTAPTVSSRTQAFGVPTIVVTCSEGLDPDIVPAIGDFVISSPARTVTAVRIKGARIEIDYSGAVLLTADTPDLAYTQNTDATRRARDVAGNLLASWIAAAVTVAAS